MKKEVEGFGYCDYHEELVDEGRYIWKGCWNCYHFSEGRDFPYVSVFQASEELGVSESTIRRSIKKGSLRGEIFEQGRFTSNLPAPRKYHINKESVEKIKTQTLKSQNSGL